VTDSPARSYDFDWLIVGSGFGGSVSALRLAEKGYSVGVLECGRRFEDEDFVRTTWNLWRYYWVPRLRMKGILRLTLFRDIFVASGCGVGGGSLGYANTLYRPGPAFYLDPTWRDLDDWEDALRPCFDEAERMLGVTEYRGEGPGDHLLKELAEELDVADTYHRTRVGVFFNDEAPGETVADPYFGGEGPPRAGCIRCGACMPGCRYNAKNTLMKNYLWFAERAGARIEPERTVVDIRPLDDERGRTGYVVESERSGRWLAKDRRLHTTRGVVVAAGALGTNELLMSAKRRGSLPRVSNRLGYLVRTNSESIPAVTLSDDRLDFTKSIAITSSIHPNEDTHIENVTYGRGADSMAFLWTLLVGPGTRLTRPLKFLARAARHPVQLARTLWPFGFSRRTVILLVMQTIDNSMRFRPKRRLLGRGVKLTTQQDPETPNPDFIPIADWTARRAAEKLDGIAKVGTTEALLNTPVTAHILGGAVMGESDETGVIDRRHRVFGYENLLVCDGSAVPANPGVNPSLTITAMTEYTISHVPHRSEAEAGRDAEGLAPAGLGFAGPGATPTPRRGDGHRGANPERRGGRGAGEPMTAAPRAHHRR
jgi:cholesterol oxidase